MKIKVRWADTLAMLAFCAFIAGVTLALLVGYSL